jgi:hypothetical protein
LAENAFLEIAGTADDLVAFRHDSLKSFQPRREDRRSSFYVKINWAGAMRSTGLFS